MRISRRASDESIPSLGFCCHFGSRVGFSFCVVAPLCRQECMFRHMLRMTVHDRAQSPLTIRKRSTSVPGAHRCQEHIGAWISRHRTDTVSSEQKRPSGHVVHHRVRSVWDTCYKVNQPTRITRDASSRERSKSAKTMVYFKMLNFHEKVLEPKCFSAAGIGPIGC